MKSFHKNGKVARFAGCERMDSSMKRFWTVLAVLLLTLSLTGILAAASPAQDMNDDGVVDEGDLKLLLQYLVGKNELPAGMTEADLDLNGNGEVDIYEAVLVLQYIEGVIPELPTVQAPPAGELKVPAGLSALVDGETYRFGETFGGYGSYVAVDDEGKALIAIAGTPEAITDGGTVYTNCFLLVYQIGTGTLAQTRSNAVEIIPQNLYYMVQVVGGTPAEQEEAKDILRDVIFDYDELDAEEQAYVDAILNGEAFEDEPIDMTGSTQTFRAELSEDGTVASFAFCDNGVVESSQRFAYENGYTVRSESYDSRGELTDYATYSYHQNGMPAETAYYSASGELRAALQRDLRGNTVGMLTYSDGVPVESERFEYVYDDNGKVKTISRYYGTNKDPETLRNQITWGEDGTVTTTEYYSDGGVAEEQTVYPDGRKEVKLYEGDGLLYEEAAYNENGELEYRRSYDQGELMYEERIEREIAEDGSEIAKRYVKEKDGEEYLAEEERYSPNGGYQRVEYDSRGGVVHEFCDDGNGTWWEKNYIEGVLESEGGRTAEGSEYYYYYDKDGSLLGGNRTELVYEDGLIKERLEYTVTPEHGEYLSTRVLYDEDGYEMETYRYNPDGSLESRSWREAYTEDGNTVTLFYEQYGDGDPVLLEKHIQYADGGTCVEQYEDGDIVYAQGFDAEGNYYYTQYDYWWTENGKVLHYVYSRYADGGRYEAYYFENGVLKSEASYQADGSGYYKVYTYEGVLIYHRETNADGSGVGKSFYENGSLEQETVYGADGDLISETYYDPDGNVTYSVRYENEYSPDGDLLVWRQYETAEDGREYLAQMTEYFENGSAESYYDPDGTLLERIRRETVFDEETGYTEERAYRQYGEGEEFLYSLTRYNEYYDVVYSIQMDEDGDPIYEEILDESGWGFDTKEWDYEYDEEGNKYQAACYEYYFDEGYRETYYLPDGTVVYDHYNYHDGRFMISEKDFYENGTLRYEHYEDNVTAWEKYYYEDGSMMAEAYGEEDGSGVRYIYYASGKLQEEYRQEADGSYRQVRYYESGVLQEEKCCDHKGNRIKYVVYLEDGTITEYDRNEYDYLDDGGFTIRSYRLNAAGAEWMGSECTYDESYDVLVRKQYTLDDNGNAYLYSHEYYDQDGNFIEKEYELNDAGEAVQVYESVTGADGSYASKSYYLNGALRSESKEDAEGNGYYREYTADGVLISESIYSGENGETNIEYDEEGNIIYYARWVTIFDEYGNDIGNRIYYLDENGNEYLSDVDWHEGDVHISEAYNTLGVMTQKWEAAPEYEKTWSYISDENGVWYLDEYRCFYENGSDEYERYYPDGTLRRSHFLDAEGNGKECLYYESGALWHERIFDGDVETNITYDEEGNITQHTISTHLYEETYSEVVTYTRLPDGTEYLSRLERYFDDEHWESFEYDADGDGIYEGRNTEEGYSYWYATYRTNEQGVKYLYCRSDHFVDGSYHSVYYYEIGEKSSEYFFDVDRNGYEKQYYANGALWKEYRFEWSEEVYYACYDAEGNLTESRGEAA